MSYVRTGQLEGWDVLNKIGSGVKSVANVYGSYAKTQGALDFAKEQDAARVQAQVQASAGGGVKQYLPYIAVGGGLLAAVLLLRRKG